MIIPRRVALPLAFVAWCIAIPLGHGVIPWAISLLTPRIGWKLENPGVWNSLAVIPLSLATALLIWVVSEYRKSETNFGNSSPSLDTAGRMPGLWVRS